MKIEKLFETEGITDYAVLPLSACRITMPRLLSRYADFEPRSVLLYLVPYYGGDTENLSLYAASRDYHLYFSEFSARIIACLEASFPGSRTVAFADHSPIDERDAAARAGLGVLGQNGLLIAPRYASLVFIGELLTDVPPEALPRVAAPAEPLTCEGCGACRRACPTGILCGCGQDCLSAITQKKGELCEAELALMKKYNTVWGCDLCQTACPHVKRAIRENTAQTPIRFFRESRTPHLTYRMIDEMPEAEFRERAYAWRGRKTLLRNLRAYERDE